LGTQSSLTSMTEFCALFKCVVLINQGIDLSWL